MTATNNIAKMHATCAAASAGEKRLFTTQREDDRFWYAITIWMVLGLAGLLHGTQMFGQVLEEWSIEDQVVQLELNWDIQDFEELSSGISDQGLVVWRKRLGDKWNGIEELDFHVSWVPVDDSMLSALDWDKKRVVQKEWTWRLQDGNSESFLFGEGSFLRNLGNGWERLESIDATLGASPVEEERVIRVWPDQSVRSVGSWYSVATTEEGVHCIGYDELQSLGIQPEELSPQSLRLFGHGGRALPLENDVDRPLDIPQQRVVLRGLDDGSFDPGDELCWYAPSLEGWNWSENDGWSHQSAWWGDTAKWFLRVDAPMELERLDIPTPPEFSGNVDVTRTSHIAYGVEEEHEVNLIKSGRNWFGTRLSAFGANTATWNIPVPHLKLDEPCTVRFAAAMRSVGTGTSSQLDVSFGQETLALTDNLLSASSLSYGKYVNGSLTSLMPTESIQVLASFTAGTDDSNAWVDYLSYQAPQNLVYNSGQFAINGLPVDEGGSGIASAEYVLGGNVPDQVWDVTNPLEVERMTIGAVNGSTVWKDEVTSVPRRYMAFRWTDVLRPIPLGAVGNSNVHGLGQVDYVVVTTPYLQQAADSLASIHAGLGKRVAVVMQQDVFDAFSSGTSDPTSIKMLMMMLRDRAELSAGEWLPPKYLLLMGDASYDNRNVQGNGNTIVGFYSSESLQTTTSYISDDYFALTAEGQAARPEDVLQFGVGRIPASDLESAMAVVGKVATYLGLEEAGASSESCLDPNGSSVYGPWRNRVLFVSDDQDGNNQDGWRYMSNSEEHSNTIRTNHNEYDVLKVYPDAYVQTNTPGGERYEDATAEIARRVDEGALIVNYIGHGGERGWAHERILNLETIQGWRNKRRLPIFMTATCELFRYDDPEVYSAGEAILFNPQGGGVALLTTTRTVYSAGNQQVNRAFFETALDDSEGRCLGDIYMDTKNSDQITSNTNSRNFSLMGDPGLALAYPSEQVFLTQIPDTIRSLEEVIVRGFVGNALGDTLTNFNGVVVPTVFDKRTSVTTLDNDFSDGPFTYEVFQNILHKGLATVEDGEFEFRFIVPRDIDYTFGTGRISCYAISNNFDAHGFSEEFVIGGTTDSPLEDLVGPQIELFMNDTLFRPGDVVHEDPWLFARVFDESGINTSGNGIGHDVKAILDGDASHPFVLNEYFVSDLDTYQSGTIRFPFSQLEEGAHELEVKIWDVANNSATANTHFVVASSIEVALLEVLAYPNPATDHVTFRMTGNQACRPANVRLEIFSPQGQLVHEQVFEGEVLGFRDDVMTWDLKPSAQGSVSPGVYVFRVTWENEFGQSAQYADQLVVLRAQ